MPRVIVKRGDGEFEIIAQQGQSLLEVLRNELFAISSPCNGNGTCGKCKVKLLSGYLPEVLPNETRSLDVKDIKDGYRLSCCYSLVSDIEILLQDNALQAQIVTEGMEHDIALCPIVTKEQVSLEKPGLSSQTADFKRVVGEVSKLGVHNMKLIRRLPDILRKEDYNITLIKFTDQIVGVESGDTCKELYGVAVDIGTTTIAAYLLDLSNGIKLCVHSALNPQKKFGADVISRIKHTMDSDAGLEEMHTLILKEINVCIETMCETMNIARTSIYAITFVGNTTMLHFLLKVSAKHMAAAPFIPSITSMLNINAEELGININTFGMACILPAVSAYIGADTVGAALSTGMYLQEEISLLIDIGTNGEIVLGNKDNLFSCSAAAGPAFEGANIRNGIGSVKGAINSISLKEGINYSTIGNASPIGICGTGIVDGIAQLLDLGIIDETGRLDDEWEPISENQLSLVKNITKIEGRNAFTICGDIAITQKDIRELQNAKAAIAAGINVLVKQSGINFDNIKNVYLAGGFGTYINIENALKIGLIPHQLEGRIKPVGNAAGQGAVAALLSRDCIADAMEISKKIKYIELSGLKLFNDLYVEYLMFEL